MMALALILLGIVFLSWVLPNPGRKTPIHYHHHEETHIHIQDSFNTHATLSNYQSVQGGTCHDRSEEENTSDFTSKRW